MTVNKALLIIDMQKGSFTSDTPRYDTQGILKRINKIAAIFRGEGYPVIFIQHDGSKENEFVPNTLGWELLEELESNPNDLVISKTANDSFYQTNLEKKLKGLNIEELIITGCATDFCVESTVQSALTKNFNVTVMKDGHTTGERPHLSAIKIIEHYNWIWQNMIPTQGMLRVMSFEDLVK